MKYIIYTDGGSRGNPGPAAIGVVICNEKVEPVKKYGEAIGEKTNNEAEYEAIIFALKKFKALFGGDEAQKAKIEMRMDSELAAKQLNHEYKIEEPHIQQLFLKIWNLMIDFGQVKFINIPREENKEADRLVNEALDKKQENLFK
ncbi:MAG: ribonuclease HI family protein [Candidatus Portnoybacteria bacterium]|nr:ribonuclease HI family protein [Candidatus Portnoybacteria bacterium]